MDVDALMEEAREALEVFDWDAAEAAARKLLDARWSGGYEMLAQACKGRGDAALECAQLLPLHAIEEFARELVLPLALQRAVRIRSLLAEERYDELFEVAAEALGRRRGREEWKTVSRIAYAVAEALWRTGEKGQALKYCWDAIELDPANDEAMWLIRRIENLRSRRAKRMELLLRGRADLPFYVKYLVVADDADEALRMAARFEGDAVAPTLEVVESKIVEPAPDEPKGVAWRSARIEYEETL